MKILFCSSECFPFSKTGGLADMAYFLPKSINKLGHEIKIITPYYEQIKRYHDKMRFLGSKTIYMSHFETIVNYYEMIYENTTYIFVQNMHYFERDSLYGYHDDAERFTCFNYAILEGLELINFYPDIIHLNDWQTAILPYLLDKHYRHQSYNYFKIHILLTIHNLQYQGNFDKSVAQLFNTDFDYSYIHFDRVNFLKAGIERATKINTVSPTYSKEVMTNEFGFSLDGALKNRQNDFSGILNGIDDVVFNPKTDKMIEKNYGLKDALFGKAENKAFILEHFGLDLSTKEPLIAYVGRLADQKGISLMEFCIEEVLEYSNAKFILMGSGDQNYENFFRYLTGKYPNRVANYIGFNEKIAHLIYAGSDMFMMPSRFEPCGLGQMIAMRYGSLPIVRETGGLKDTVIPYNKYTNEGTGFTFANYDSYDLKEKLFESIHVYNNQASVWKKLVNQAMKTDYGLNKMAISYEKIYKEMLGEK
ncbi:glycogen synthase [Acholeplasma granularum]|uniref:glycogen synthase n=1 Tax=Acholeplasma granularum TaxID=264635 RepID=UPI000471E1CB|nr:glycogen/starch synthase [Acholeplasma granularum]